MAVRVRTLLLVLVIPAGMSIGLWFASYGLTFTNDSYSVKRSGAANGRDGIQSEEIDASDDQRKSRRQQPSMVKPEVLKQKQKPDGKSKPNIIRRKVVKDPSIQVSKNIAMINSEDNVPVQNKTIASEESLPNTTLKNGEIHNGATTPGIRKIKTQFLDDNVRQVVRKYMKAASDGFPHIKIVREVFKARLRDNADEYAGTYPFMSGDTVRGFADVQYSPLPEPGKYVLSTNENSKWLGKDGEVIFVQTEYVYHFVEDLLPNITHKFILVSHVSDFDAPDGNTSWLLSDPRLIAWFARNARVSDSHPHRHKLIPLPIGLRDSYLNQQFISEGNTMTLMQRLRHLPPMYDGDPTSPSASLRPNLVYMNFNMERHFTRAIVKELLGPIGLDRTSRNLTQYQYFHDLRESKFVASPEGYGIDCYRTWEAIAFGAIPIVRNSSLWPLFAVAPVLVVNQWTAHEVNLTVLNNFKVSPEATRDVILADYWFDKIDSYRSK